MRYRFRCANANHSPLRRSAFNRRPSAAKASNTPRRPRVVTPLVTSVPVLVRCAASVGARSVSTSAVMFAATSGARPNEAGTRERGARMLASNRWRGNLVPRPAIGRRAREDARADSPAAIPRIPGSATDVDHRSMRHDERQQES